MASLPLATNMQIIGRRVGHYGSMTLKAAEWSARRYEVPNKGNDHRDPYYRDYARLVHSAAFRRLQAKTQVLGLGESDFYRTRLTHSLEVAQIGAGLVVHLRAQLQSPVAPLKSGSESWLDLLPSEKLIEAICLAHDLGHPPFGHGGERALNYAMRSVGGFEGNGQTLRILSRLEKNSEEHGLNPTRRLLLGILKYPAKYSKVVKTGFAHLEGDIFKHKDDELKPPKCYHDDEEKVVQWILEPFSADDQALFQKFDADRRTRFKALDTSIMEIADDIAYGVHDLEDCVHLGLVRENHWKDMLNEKPKGKQETYSMLLAKHLQLDLWREQLFSEQEVDRKKAVSNMVHALITNVFLRNVEGFEHPILSVNADLADDAKVLLKFLGALVRKHVIGTAQVRTLERKGQMIVFQLFEVLKSDPEAYLKASTFEKYKTASKVSDKDGLRVICDYVAGMTDEYATKLYQRLFTPRFGSIFDV